MITSPPRNSAVSTSPTITTMKPLRSSKLVLAKADSATSNRVRMALHMPLVLEDHKESESALNPRLLGERRYTAGFLKDALRYFTLAYEADPSDTAVALKLGWTNNLLHDDATADPLV
jgi:hypothetical protein